MNRQQMSWKLVLTMPERSMLKPLEFNIQNRYNTMKDYSFRLTAMSTG